MSRPFSKVLCLSAGLAFAIAAAGSANAAKPLSGKPQNQNTVKKPLTVKQKNEMARAVARTPQKAPPKTMAEAEANMRKSGGMRKDGGMMFLEVPEEVYNYLTASADADGKMHVRDTDASGHSHAHTVEVSNEK